MNQPKKTVAALVAAANTAAAAVHLDEAETRKLIDQQLNQAGWIADSATLTYSAGARPEKGKNMAIAEWPTANGPADYGTMVKFTQLAEGEQQLLTVLGLLLFTQHDESLYLLDEPDTHLNPVWTYDYLKLLQDNIYAQKGQLIVATHNPLMIGSLRKNQVRVLAQQGDFIVASEPDYDPLGIGVEGLLKSELYGLRSTLAPEVLNKLDRHYLLLGKEGRTDGEQSELMSLANEINELGVARTHPNPYFEQFANAMAWRRSKKSQTGLSKEVIQSQKIPADEVLKEILVEEQSGKEGGVV